MEDPLEAGEKDRKRLSVLLPHDLELGHGSVGGVGVDEEGVHMCEELLRVGTTLQTALEVNRREVLGLDFHAGEEVRILVLLPTDGVAIATYLLASGDGPDAIFRPLPRKEVDVGQLALRAGRLR